MNGNDKVAQGYCKIEAAIGLNCKSEIVANILIQFLPNITQCEKELVAITLLGTALRVVNNQIEAYMKRSNRPAFLRELLADTLEEKDGDRSGQYFSCDEDGD